MRKGHQAFKEKLTRLEGGSLDAEGTRSQEDLLNVHKDYPNWQICGEKGIWKKAVQGKGETDSLPGISRKFGRTLVEYGILGELEEIKINSHRRGTYFQVSCTEYEGGKNWGSNGSKAVTTATSD